MADGKVIIETGIDSSGAFKGLKKLEKTIKSDTKSATKELDGQTNQLNKDLKKVGNTGSKAMNQISTGASKSSKSIDGLKLSLSKVAGILATAFSIHQLINIGKESINLASDLMEVQNVVDTAFGSMSQKMEDFADTAIETYGISKLTAKNIGSTYTAMARGIGQSLDEATDRALEMTGRVADIASFYNLSIDRANTIGRAVYSGETEPLKQIGVIMTENQLQTFALANGYSKLYKNMSAAEKLEVRQAYFLAQTNLAAGDFVKTQNSWANQTRILSERWKEFLSVLGSGLIQILTPVLKMLNQILSAATSALIAFNKFLGINTEITSTGGGVSSGIGDISSGMEDLTDSTNNATTAQKKLQKSLGEYDKLKVISKDTSSDVSGGSGASGIGSGLSNIDIKETLDTDKLQNNLLKNIDFFELGRNISNKLTEMLRNIPWDKIYEGARNFGTNLAEFLNGLISPELFGAVGETIASALNTAIYFALAFGTTFDWKDLGNSLAAGVNNFFATFDFAALADTIDAWVQGIWNMIVTFFKNLDYKTIFSGIAEFFTSLDPETIAILLGFFALKKIIKLATSIHIGKAFSEALHEAFKTSFSKLALKIHSMFSGVTAALKNAFSSITAFIASAGKILGGIGLVIGGVITAFKNFFDMLSNGFNWIKEVLMLLGIALTAVGAIILGAPALVAAAVAGVVAAVATLVIVIKDNWESVKDFTIKIWNSIKDFFHKLWEGIKEIFQKALEFIKDFIHNTFELIKEIVSSVMEFMWSMIKARLELVKDIFEVVFGVVRDIISTTFEHIKTVFGDIKDVFDNIIQFIRDVFAGNWENIWHDIVNIFESIWNTMVDIAKYPINLVIDLINGLIGGVEAAVNFIANALSAIHFDVPDWVPGIGGKSLGFNFSGVSLPRIPQLAKGTVIPPNKEFMAILGDQKQGTNIETPLKTMIDAFNKALDDRGGSNNGDIIIEIDGKEVFRAIRKQNNDYKKITGKSALA